MVVGIVRRWSPRSWNGLKCRWRNCIRFSCRNNSSLRLNSLGPLCLWQCFLFGHCGVISKNAFQCCQICNFLILFENCIFSRYEIWFLLFCECDEDALTGKFSLERVGALDKAIKDTSDDTFDDTIWQDTRYNLIHRNRRQWHEMSDSVSRASCPQLLQKSGHKKLNPIVIQSTASHFHCCDKFIQIRSSSSFCHQEYWVWGFS